MNKKMKSRQNIHIHRHMHTHKHVSKCRNPIKTQNKSPYISKRIQNMKCTDYEIKIAPKIPLSSFFFGLTLLGMRTGLKCGFCIQVFIFEKWRQLLGQEYDFMTTLMLRGGTPLGLDLCKFYVCCPDQSSYGFQS